MQSKQQDINAVVKPAKEAWKNCEFLNAMGFYFHLSMLLNNLDSAANLVTTVLSFCSGEIFGKPARVSGFLFLSAICICKLQTMQGCSNFDHYFM